jgi:hypothetical protein
VFPALESAVSDYLKAVFSVRTGKLAQTYCEAFPSVALQLRHAQ